MSSNDRSYTYKLVIGDSSQDGHGMTATYRIRSNKPSSEVRAAYLKMKEETGIDFSTICEEYDDCALSEDTVSRLRDAGIPLPADTEWIYPDDFVKMLLAFIMKGDAELALCVIESEEDLLEDARCGWGYGLFSL